MNRKKDFDCVKMKNDIQAAIYEETKDMNFAEYKAYLAKRLQNSPFWERFKQQQSQSARATF